MKIAGRVIESASRIRIALAFSLVLWLPIHYGRVIVALTFGCGIRASATLSIPDVPLLPMATEFGWSIGDFSGPRWKAGRHGVGWF